MERTRSTRPEDTRAATDEPFPAAPGRRIRGDSRETFARAELLCPGEHASYTYTAPVPRSCILQPCGACHHRAPEA